MQIKQLNIQNNARRDPRGRDIILLAAVGVLCLINYCNSASLYQAKHLFNYVNIKMNYSLLTVLNKACFSRVTNRF